MAAPTPFVRQADACPGPATVSSVCTTWGPCSKPCSPRRAGRVSIGNVVGTGHALPGESATLDDFGQLDLPVLPMTGSESPPAPRGVARLLAQGLPRMQPMNCGRVWVTWAPSPPTTQ